MEAMGGPMGSFYHYVDLKSIALGGYTPPMEAIEGPMGSKSSFYHYVDLKFGLSSRIKRRIGTLCAQ
jgi:hypothetical protein